MPIATERTVGAFTARMAPRRQPEGLGAKKHIRLTAIALAFVAAILVVIVFSALPH